MARYSTRRRYARAVRARRSTRRAGSYRRTFARARSGRARGGGQTIRLIVQQAPTSQPEPPMGLKRAMVRQARF